MMKYKLQNLTFYPWLTKRPSPDPRSARWPLRPSRSLITFRVCSFVEGRNGTWENIIPDLFSFLSLSQLLSIKERNVQKVKAPLVWKALSVQAYRTWPRVHRLQRRQIRSVRWHWDRTADDCTTCCCAPRGWPRNSPPFCKAYIQDKHIAFST